MKLAALPRRFRVGLTPAVALVASCAGSVGSAGPESESGAQAPGGGGSSGAASSSSGTGGVGGVRPPACANQPPRPGPAPLRRLTSLEYKNTIQALLNDSSIDPNQFPSHEVDPDRPSFSNDANGLTVSVLAGEAFLSAAEQVAANAVKNLPGLLGCTPAPAGAAEETCVKSFVDAFGKRAYRRPLLPSEAVDLLNLYKTIRTKDDVPGAVSGLLVAFLMSPHFLYRVEVGAPSPAGAPVRLTGYEIATRLAYMFLGSMPDAALVRAADAGQLATPAQIEQQARRLLAAPPAKAMVEQFHTEWLKLDDIDGKAKSDASFAALALPMLQETKAFLKNVIWDGDARLQTLLVSAVSFPSPQLATNIYKLPSGTVTAPNQRVGLDPAQRAGILTQPAVLSVFAGSHESDVITPIARGQLVRTRLLCQEPTPPPGDVPPPPAPSPGQTLRQRLETHRTAPQCAGCHKLYDLVGFGFENYDAVGRYRTKDGALPVDNSGELVATSDLDGTFRGVAGGAGLAGKLAQSSEVSECVSKLWFRYAFGRHETEQDACSLARVNAGFMQSGRDIRELLVQLTQTEAFQFRAAGGAP